MPVVMQWDLITRKFDMKYILDLNLSISRIEAELNSDNTLLAISGGKLADIGYVVCVYLTKSEIYDEYMRYFCFIGSGEEERLFFSCMHLFEPNSHNSYILNPRTHILDKPPDTHVLHDIYHVAFNDKSIGPINIIDYSVISDYIIKRDNNYLLIQKLSQNDIWIEYLKNKEQYYGNSYTYFNVKEIMQFIQEILEKYNYKEYESDRILTQNFSNEPEFYSGESFTWIIEYEKEKEFWEVQLKAQIETDMIIHARYFTLEYGSILEIKMLKNGDILLICQLRILIYTIEYSEKGVEIKLIYCWSDELEYNFEVPKLPKNSIINLLTLFKRNKKNLIGYNFDSEVLPSPTLDALTYKSTSRELERKNSAIMKLYGKDIFKLLLKRKSTFLQTEINELLNYCYDHSLSMLKKGDIYSFILIASQIAYILTRNFSFSFCPFFASFIKATSEYSYDQPNFSDDANNPWNLVPTYQFISSNGSVGKSTLIETPDNSTNLFTMFSTSVLAVYFMLTGDLSYVSSWVLKNSWTLAFLLVIFSFFTTVYLLNLFISLLGNAIDYRNNEESFLQLRGEISTEIELFWMLPHQRRKPNWFPEILWYRASVKELKKYIESVEDKKSLDPKILKITKTKTEDSEETLKKTNR
ncbi:hypothetical protein C2G38_2048308 [Gigaspora rosea]|uniref:Ion transport domain-containing protein n=1 Tax=Gigaspora rosea TaxID=44941 RepID=A0A397U775_9GLOM|nr:hypothetical protein C2G38_2048308 [Gigaspora rosea]